MKTITSLVGNHAVAYAVKQAKPNVLAVYPITPQTTMLEKLADYVSSGELKAELIKVESEHSAVASILGAALAGARVFTATASQGLLYMGEMIYWVGGARVPLVAAIATRAIGAPWSIWDDHEDFLTKRDAAWIQLMAQNVQEAYDLTIQAFKISEDKKIIAPCMLGFDGFILTHTMERLELLDDSSVDNFIGKRDFSIIDFDNPVGIGTVAGPQTYMGYKYSIKKAFDGAKERIKEIMKEYSEISNIDYQPIECYKCDDADYLIAVGAWSGDARVAVDMLRSEGKKVGLIRIIMFRPFPKEEISKYIKGKDILVLDRDYSFGSGGILANEIKSISYNLDSKIYSLIAGLGGKDVSEKEIKALAEKMINKELGDEEWLM